MYGTPTGLSSSAIAYGGADHPWDPSDLLRCVTYCTQAGISTDRLRERMAGRSVKWDRLLREWGALTDLLSHEMTTRKDGKAPLTYFAMRRVLDDGVTCAACDGTGRGEPCLKCKGTGYRSGGTCRAPACFEGAALCAGCRGRGYVPREQGA